MQKEDTELAAALFFLLGEMLPHNPLREPEAFKLKEQIGDREKTLLKIVELCGEPRTPCQYYICAKAYSWLGKDYCRQVVHYAGAYLHSPGWDALPSGTRAENGVRINLSDRCRAGIWINLASALSTMENLEQACSAFMEAYELEPSNAVYAVQAANSLVKMGRADEAENFLSMQKRSAFYRPAKYRDSLGRQCFNDSFRRTIDLQISKLAGKQAK